MRCRCLPLLGLPSVVLNQLADLLLPLMRLEEEDRGVLHPPLFHLVNLFGVVLIMFCNDLLLFIMVNNHGDMSGNQHIILQPPNES